jgi:5-methylcytosine-specific restriction endonuclease McrA
VAIQVEVKTCTKCGETKPATTEFFYAEKTGRGGLAAHCKVCHAAACSRYQAEHKEAHDRAMAAYYQRNKAARGAYSRQWERSHPENVARNSAKNHRLHPETRAAVERRRQARKMQATGSHTGADVLAQRARQGGLCFWCKKKLTEHHADHVVPLALGGSDGPENIVVSCPTCNRSKHARHPMDYAGVML